MYEDIEYKNYSTVILENEPSVHTSQTSPEEFQKMFPPDLDATKALEWYFDYKCRLITNDN